MSKTELIQHIDLPSKSNRHKLFGSVTPGPKTKPTDKDKMADLQNMNKDFLFDIDAVGISNVKHPVIIKSTLQPTTQTTVGTFQLTSNINKMTKGTNMSRFLELLDSYHHSGLTIDFNTLKQFAVDLAVKLQQEKVDIEVSFPWFYERHAPASEHVGMNHADVTLKIAYNNNEGFTLQASLSTLVTTLCPCSKEISEYSAHSQRGKVTMDVQFVEDFDDMYHDWKKDLLNAAETNASAKIHPVLKRPDEKVVTEEAYENPRFVEDVVRLVAADLYEIPYIESFEVTCENEESIHMHNAIAKIRYNKKDR